MSPGQGSWGIIPARSDTVFRNALVNSGLRHMRVRSAAPDDVASLMELRNWYVANSYATFDETPLCLADVQAWFSRFGRGPHRLLVAQSEGRLLGYCSSQQYRAHAAFSRTVETSIYVNAEFGRSGVGSALYGELFGILSDQNLHRAVAGIALPNEASIRIHEKFGFRRVGVFSEYAIKHGRYISSQWMERDL